MITKLLSSKVIKTTLFVFVFLWTTLAVYAQCPTLNPTPPTSPICNATGFKVSDLNAYAINTGGGIAWYTSSTGGTALSSGQLVTERRYYLDTDPASCAVRLFVDINFTINPTGQNLDKVYCGNENPTIQTYIDNVLSAYIPSGGSVIVYNNSTLTSEALPSEVLPKNNLFKNYFIVFYDGLNGTGCASQIEQSKIAVYISPDDPTPTNPQMFCADTNPTVGNLNTGTTLTNYNWYSNIDMSGDPIDNLDLTTPLVNGKTYYIQVDNGCVSNAVPVTVNIDTPVEPGTSASLDYCDDSLPASDFNLFDELGVPKVTTGSWSGPLSTSGGYLGTVNISTLTTAGTYVFTYTVPSTGVCPDGVATVTITVYETLSSGTPSAINLVTFCESTTPNNFDLYSLLDNEDLNGQWTQGTLSTDPVVTSPIDLSSFAPNTYNFTYTQNLSPNPCPEQSTTVQVVVLPNPNAGIADNKTFCENELVANSPFNLFDALDGSQDDNLGTWRDASGTTISSSLVLTTLTVAGSPYLFNYTIDNGNCTDTEIITITIEPAPESGTANAPVEFCEGSAPASFDLYSLIEGESGTGTWTNNATSAVVANPTSLDLSGFTSNTYNFTFNIDPIGTCDDVDVIVSVIINPLPNTGTANNPAPYCENDPALNNTAFNLFTLLTGTVDSGGTWNDDSTTPVSGALSGSMLDLSQLIVNTYNFTYSITDAKGCTNSTTVTIVIEPAPESGTANPPVEFCVAEITTGQTYNLFDLLTGEDQTGVWSDDDSSLALSGNLVTLEGLASGTYNFTYDVDAVGSCDDVNVTVSIIINDTPAPTAPATQEFCDTATVSNLTATGTTIQWYNNATGGNALLGTTSLINGEDYFATQIDATSGCESSVRTAVTATIYQSPKSGNAIAMADCNTNNAIDLFTGLDGTQDAGGVWNNDDGVGTLTGSTFDATGVIPGNYQFTYLVTASAPCVDSSTTITVTVDAPLDAGTNNTLDVCSNNGTTDLFTLIGSADTGGTWSPAMASGSGVFDPLVDASGTYTYTLTNSCGTDTSEVVVSVTLAPNAGNSNTAAICVIDGPTDLFSFLGTSAQSGGTWSPALPSGTGVFDPNSDTPGIYTYTVAAVSPCSPDSSAQITVSINDSPPIVVTEFSPSFCMIENPTVADLSASIQPTGTVLWYTDVTLSTPLNETTALVDGEDYFATQITSTGCESSISVQINVTINDAPTPTLIDTTKEYCINDAPTIYDLSQNIGYDETLYNLVWYDDPSRDSAISDTSLLTNLTIYYASLINLVTGCESSVPLVITPDLTSCGELFLPDGFSPNGDGVNDTYEINNLGILYPNFEMEIYNRYGNIVYKGNASTPRFNGTSNQSRTVVKGDLPVGMYYYIFIFNDGENKPKQGHLYLSR